MLLCTTVKHDPDFTMHYFDCSTFTTLEIHQLFEIGGKLEEHIINGSFHCIVKYFYLFIISVGFCHSKSLSTGLIINLKKSFAKSCTVIN